MINPVAAMSTQFLKPRFMALQMSFSTKRNHVSFVSLEKWLILPRQEPGTSHRTIQQGSYGRRPVISKEIRSQSEKAPHLLKMV